MNAARTGFEFRTSSGPASSDPPVDDPLNGTVGGPLNTVIIFIFESAADAEPAATTEPAWVAAQWHEVRAIQNRLPAR